MDIAAYAFLGVILTIYSMYLIANVPEKWPLMPEFLKKEHPPILIILYLSVPYSYCMAFFCNSTAGASGEDLKRGNRYFLHLSFLSNTCTDLLNHRH